MISVDFSQFLNPVFVVVHSDIDFFYILGIYDTIAQAEKNAESYHSIYCLPANEKLSTDEFKNFLLER